MQTQAGAAARQLFIDAYSVHCIAGHRGTIIGSAVQIRGSLDEVRCSVVETELPQRGLIARLAV